MRQINTEADEDSTTESSANPINATEPAIKPATIPTTVSTTFHASEKYSSFNAERSTPARRPGC